jgi:hypothetical protein
MCGAEKVFGLNGSIDSYSEEDISALARVIAAWINLPQHATNKGAAVRRPNGAVLYRKRGGPAMRFSVPEQDDDELVAEIARVLSPTQFRLARVAG